MPSRLTTFRALVAVSTVAVAAFSASPPSSTAAASSVTCHRWASSAGSDSNDGTSPARALATLGTLAASLAPGQTGCIPAGDRFVAHGQGVIGAVSATASAPITIRSGPGGRATIVGGLLFNHRSHDIVFTELDVVGDGFTGNAIQVEGRSIRLDRIDVRHPTGICIGVGAIDAYQTAYSGVEALDVTITNSRIHECGTSPANSPKWQLDTFSGSHGIYVVNARRTRIAENAIYANKYRGVQVFPRGVDTVVEHNVLDGNATHVNVGSTLAQGYPWRSSGTVVRGNVMSNRVTNFRPDKNSAQVHGNFPAGTAAEGNTVAGNCWVDEPGPEVTGNAIAVGNNKVGIARYVDRAAGDFGQPVSSPCVGYGPRWTQPDAGATTEPAVACRNGRAEVTLPGDVRTPSGTGTWAYSRLWLRIDGGDWQTFSWFASWANSGSAHPWWYQAPGADWRQIPATVSLPAGAGRAEVWEQRWELVGGEWHFEWHWAGACTVA